MAGLKSCPPSCLRAGHELRVKAWVIFCFPPTQATKLYGCCRTSAVEAAMPPARKTLLGWKRNKMELYVTQAREVENGVIWFHLSPLLRIQPRTLPTTCNFAPAITDAHFPFNTKLSFFFACSYISVSKLLAIPQLSSVSPALGSLLWYACPTWCKVPSCLFS